MAMLKAAASAVLVLLTGAPVAASVVESNERGFTVASSVLVKSDPQASWRELVTPSAWWSSAHTWSGSAANLSLDPGAGGCFCEKWDSRKPDNGPAVRAGSAEHMRVIYAEPGSTLRMAGALGPLQTEALRGTLTVHIKPAQGGSLISWEYVVGGYMRFKPEAIAPAVDKVLSEQFAALATRLGPAPQPSNEPVH
ncbi:MAG: hypothetical protein AB7P20_28435 [Rhizobiaceae bacterium]